MENPCAVCAMFEIECHLTTYSKIVVIDLLLEIEPESRKILMWRTGVTILNSNAIVCFHHKHVFLNRYPM